MLNQRIEIVRFQNLKSDQTSLKTSPRRPIPTSNQLFSIPALAFVHYACRDFMIKPPMRLRVVFVNLVSTPRL
jgi:hypothetical protein